MGLLLCCSYTCCIPTKWHDDISERELFLLHSKSTVSIGVNISEGKSGTERPKKRKLVFFPTAMGRNWYSSTLSTDTPQFRGGNPYFFSENPYQSVSFIYASMYLENVHAIHITVHIAMEFGKKSRHCVIKIDSQQQRTKIGASFHVARQWD